MELDVLYFFKYTSETDVSEFVEKIHCSDIINVEVFKPDGVQIKTRYAFRIELKDKIHIFCQDYALQVNNWVRAIKRAKKSGEELNRTANHQIVKNIDGLVYSFRMKRGHEVIRYCNDEFDQLTESVRFAETVSFDTFIKAGQASQLNLFDVVCTLSEDPRCSPGIQAILPRAV